MNKFEAVEKLFTPPSTKSGSSGGYDPSFFEQLAKVEDRHFWFQSRNRLIFGITRKLTAKLEAGIHESSRLDVAPATSSGFCGRPVLTAPWWVWNFGWMDFASPSNGLADRLVQGDVRSSPFGKPFELIGMFDVLEHIPEEVETLVALREALAPGGTLMLTVPAHQHLWSYFDEAAHHCRRYSSQEIRARLVEAGFEVEFLSQFMTCIFPMVWLFRKTGNRRHNSEDARTLAMKEFRVIPLINGLLTAMLRLETFWLGRGWRLPIGTSLIVVARKP